MSESNGHAQNDWRERMDRLEASHVKLMTDYGLFVAEQKEAWRRRDTEWERDHAEELEYRKAQRERDAARDLVMDKRIGELVTAIGAFIGRHPEGGAQ